MAHEIKLAGPWEFSDDDGATWTRCILPLKRAQVNPSTASPKERCQLRRRFHAPSGLESSSQVFIRLASEAAPVAIRMNDKHAIELSAVENHSTTDPEFDAEITDVLQPFNTLTICIDHNAVDTLQAVRVRIVERV